MGLRYSYSGAPLNIYAVTLPFDWSGIENTWYFELNSDSVLVKKYHLKLIWEQSQHIRLAFGPVFQKFVLISTKQIKISVLNQFGW